MVSRPDRQSVVHELVGLVYEAALQPSGWHDFLRAVGRATSGRMPGLSVHAADGRCSFALTLDCDPLYLARFEAHYGAVLADAIGRVGRPNGALVLRETFPSAVLQRWEYYLDWVQPQGFRDALAYIRSTPAGSFGFGAFRERRQRDFGAAEIRLVERIGPHFVRAYDLQRRLGTLEADRAAATGVLERLSDGVVLLDARSRLLFANAAAEAIVAREPAVSLDRSGLHAGDPAVERVLSHHVREALEVARGGGLETGGAVAIPRGRQRRPLEIVATPLVGATIRIGAATAAAAIFVCDPESRPAPAAVSLQRLLGLTPAEARLAAALAVGDSLDRAADRLSIARETARNHLKQIFERTDTNRQAELVALLHCVAPLARDGAIGGDR